MSDMQQLQSQFLFEFSADLEVPLDVGDTPQGQRRIIMVKGGTFEGPRLSGEVLQGGGDWLLVRSDGARELDVRATLRTYDNHLIYVHYRGIMQLPAPVLERFNRGERDIDPSSYYFRTTPVFETGSEKYGWLNRIVAVGVGRRTGSGVAYAVFEIL